jgi:DNA polymerase
MVEIEFNCQRCPTDIWKHRRKIVPGYGPTNAKVMFIGEAPGAQEDKQGKPFVGRAGDVFNSLLHWAELDRSKVYVTNIVKCRPVDEKGRNRAPTQVEHNTCSKYLSKELIEIEPHIICPMGNSALSYFYPTKSIGKVHGQVIETKTAYYDWVIIPLYHPAVAIYKKEMFKILLEDMKVVTNELKKID